MSESKFYYFSADGSFYGLKSLDEAIVATNDGGFIWLDYYKPSKDDLGVLVDTLGIHPLSVEDCFDEKQVPKIEYFPKNTFIIFKAFSYIEKSLVIDEINFFLGKNFLITVSGQNSDTRRHLDKIEAMVENGPSNARSGPDFLMHIVLDYLVDQVYQTVEDMEDELEDAEELLVSDVESFQPLQLIHMRKDLMTLRKRIYHEREILFKICRSDCPFIGEKAIVHYRDIYDHLAKLFELIDSFREIETSLMELYTSLLNNLMTRMSNQTNTSVRRLTLLSTVFMPLTLLASIGGMSEWTMITGQENWKISYPLFILGMIAIAILNFFIIRRLEKRGSSLYDR